MPRGWPQDLQWASFNLQMQANIAQLSADMSCLAACPVACQALSVSRHWLMGTQAEHAAAQLQQLAAAVAPLAATITYLFLEFYVSPRKAAVLSLCQALPQLHSLCIGSTFFFPDLSSLPQHRPPLRSLTLQCNMGCRNDSWTRDMLQACATEQGAARPPLTVQLPRLPGQQLQAARLLWARLSTLMAPVSRVLVTDCKGRDLMAAQ
jgi:hypothetical protein